MLIDCGHTANAEMQHRIDKKRRQHGRDQPRSDRREDVVDTRQWNIRLVGLHGAKEDSANYSLKSGPWERSFGQR